MNQNIIGAIIAAAVGVCIAFMNYIISKAILEKSPDKYSMATVIRQVIQIGYLVIVYFVGEKILGDPMYLLIGAVLGVTLPMFLFTKKLLSFNETLYGKDKRKEEETDG